MTQAQGCVLEGRKAVILDSRFKIQGENAVNRDSRFKTQEAAAIVPDSRRKIPETPKLLICRECGKNGIAAPAGATTETRYVCRECSPVGICGEEPSGAAHPTACKSDSEKQAQRNWDAHCAAWRNMLFTAGDLDRAEILYRRWTNPSLRVTVRLIRDTMRLKTVARADFELEYPGIEKALTFEGIIKSGLRDHEIKLLILSAIFGVPNHELAEMNGIGTPSVDVKIARCRMNLLRLAKSMRYVN